MQWQDCIISLTEAATKIRFCDVGKAHERTFQWLFDPAIVSFSSWLGDQSFTKSNSLYWIKGKPGSGKSTLMKYAINDPRTWQLLRGTEGSDWAQAAFFFHNRGSAIQKSLAGMLRELLSSLLQQLPELLFCIEPEYTKLARAQRVKRPTWDLDSLRSAFFSLAEQRRVPFRVILFLDALDEHAGDNDVLADILKTICDKADNSCITLKICLASRSWNVFEHYFGRCSQLAIHEHTQNDIREYTKSQLQASTGSRLDLLSFGQLDMLTRQITLKALGVFIWVRLVVEQLAKDIRNGALHTTLEERVNEMPQELEQLYADILRRLGVLNLISSRRHHNNSRCLLLSPWYARQGNSGNSQAHNMGRIVFMRPRTAISNDIKPPRIILGASKTFSNFTNSSPT